MKKFLKILFILLSIIIPIAIILILANYEVYEVWNSWGLQSVGETFICPDGFNYSLLVLFKLTLYLIPPALFAIFRTIENKKNVKKKKYLYYFSKCLNSWFLFILIVKLAGDSIFEVDRIWGWKLFESVKDVQTLIGYIFTFILQSKFKIEPDKIETANSK